ncbi:carbon-nitrogen hydrolase family protein [Streptomyces sp. ISL-10]|uniref:carbon-nitrogen hydrolase family protein n=1 Tax=Streptomyces sp. ISL-10 TaxID=2819172 RepID=UPI001BEA4D1E|nr:carbon-nitrogen hydrolase family protein [Streptomyces sp. ISL-10]MBT2366231.1 carbon-nitrogen hydrolase family protein [Streptomyces sp. ISL-10]
MRIAAAQFPSVPGDIEANVGSMAALVHEAGARGARFVAFCELAAQSYALAPIAADPGMWLAEDDPRLEPVREACRTTATAALVGCAARADGDRPTISALVIGPDGGLLARYDKTHLYGAESEVFTAGAEEGRFELGGVRFSVAICYDNRFPELAGRAKADDCRVYVASSVLAVDNDSFEKVYPARARDNGLYVLLANQIGTGDEGECRGGSAVWGPDGTLLADAGRSAAGVAVVELAAG